MKQKFEEATKRIKADDEQQLDTRGVRGNELHANKILQALEKVQRKADLISCNANNFYDNVVCNGSCQNMFEDEEDAALAPNPDDDPEIKH